MIRRSDISGAVIASALVASALLFAGCGADRSGADGSGGDPAAETRGDVRALFDTDLPASSMLRDRLSREFGMAPDVERLEAALTAEDYFCGPDPSVPDEMACLRERPRGSCTEASLVRIKPWRPDQAQVVVICEPGQSPVAAATP